MSPVDHILENLNEAQYEGVTTTDGPVLILAGAGSGKTKVLTHRLSYILKTGKAEYENILAVTFTNKAAKEMKERISKLLSIDLSGYYGSNLLPFMGTFHSICVKILRRDGQVLGIEPNFAILDTNDQMDVVKEIMKVMNLSTKEFSPYAIHDAISSAKNELKDAKEFEKFAQGYFLQTASKIYVEYEKTLHKNNVVDFDDLIMSTVKLFKNHEDVLKRYQDLFKYILVDEYQDTNHAQYTLVNMLSGLHRNICVVGDPDQSIYSFRGADISNILSFERDYPDTKVIKLEQNYRSTKNILDAAQNVIEQNKSRKEKKLISNKGTGDKITIYEAANEGDESRFITRSINSYILNNGHLNKPLNNIAILYRTNAQSRTIEEQLLRDRIPYVLVGGLRFYDRKEIKDLLSYLRMIYNPVDDTTLKRVINTPVRGIGPKAYSDLLKSAEHNSMSGINLLLTIADLSDEDLLSIKTEDSALAKIATNQNIKNFAIILKKIFEKAVDLPPAELLEFILNEIKYVEYIDDKTTEAESRKENIKELFSVAEKYSELDPSVGLAEFLTDVALVEQQSENIQDESMGAVTLMTIHAAKGLEFDSVFLVGMEEGLFPHSRVFTDPTELEEERRLCYVAITRAKAKLYVVYAMQRMLYGRIGSNPASRFLAEIPEHLIEFVTAGTSFQTSYKKDKFADFDYGMDNYIDYSKIKNQSSANAGTVTEVSYDNDVYLEIGDKVKHVLFGQGTILSADESMISVRFERVGVKKLSKEYAKLEKV
jgi:DNA helicase-2/ATP-dependent DNA helicase PcrA